MSTYHQSDHTTPADREELKPSLNTASTLPQCTPADRARIVAAARLLLPYLLHPIETALTDAGYVVAPGVIAGRACERLIRRQDGQR